MGAPGSDVITMFYLGAPLALLYAVALGVALPNDRRRAKNEALHGTDGEAENQRGAQPLSEITPDDANWALCAPLLLIQITRTDHQRNVMRPLTAVPSSLRRS